MRTLVLALMALSASPMATAETFCAAERHGDRWEVTAGSKSYSLKASVFFVLPDAAKVRFVSVNDLMGYTYGAGGDAELNYRSDGDIYFRTAALAVNTGETWASVAQVLSAQGKTFGVAFRDPGDEIFAYAALGDQMAGRMPTQFGILKAPQAAPLRERLESGKPFDVLLATNDALFAETPGFVFPDFAGGKAEAEATLAGLKIQADSGACQ